MKQSHKLKLAKKKEKRCKTIEKIREIKAKKNIVLDYVFHIRGLFDYVLQFTDELDKSNLIMTSKQYKTYLISSSKYCPIHYKFTPDFFFDNINNEAICEIYFKYYYKFFHNKITTELVATYCHCETEIYFTYGKCKFCKLLQSCKSNIYDTAGYIFNVDHITMCRKIYINRMYEYYPDTKFYKPSFRYVYIPYNQNFIDKSTDVIEKKQPEITELFNQELKKKFSKDYIKKYDNKIKHTNYWKKNFHNMSYKKNYFKK